MLQDAKIQALSAELEKLKVKEDKLPLESNGLNGSVSSPDISFQVCASLALHLV